MDQHLGDVPAKKDNVEGLQIGDGVERRAASRFLDEQSLTKFDLSVETPEGAKLISLALNPERHPQGVPGFHTDSLKRLEEQSAKVAKGCSPEEIMKMMDNNTFMMEAATMRVQALMQTGNRSSLANVIEGDQLRFT